MSKFSINENFLNYHVKSFDSEGNLIGEAKGKNLITNEGFNNLLNILFSVQGQNTFYVRLIDAASFTALADADSAAQIGGSNGWIEDLDFSTSVPTLVCAAAASQATTNSATTANFTMNTSGTLIGFFTCSAQTGTTGFIFNEAEFSSGTLAYTSGGLVQVTCNYTAANCS